VLDRWTVDSGSFYGTINFDPIRQSSPILPTSSSFSASHNSDYRKVVS
jgi:hypothetical protein